MKRLWLFPAAALIGVCALALWTGAAIVEPPAPDMAWEETLRGSVDKDGLTAAQVRALLSPDVFSRCKVPMVAGKVPEAFFYWKVRNKVAADLVREESEAKRAALVAETIDRLKTMMGMTDVAVTYEDGRLVVTGQAVTEIRQ